MKKKCTHPECTSVAKKEGLCIKHWKMCNAGASNGEPQKKKAKKQQVKKPMSAHMHFSLANRADVKECQPDLSASEVTSTVATNWKALSADERSFWEEKAAADEERYQKELADNQIEDGLSKEGEDVEMED